MAQIKWNTAAFEAACIGVTMDRLEEAADTIVADAKRILQSKIKGPPVTRHNQKEIWMERDPGALVETIRWARKWGSDTRDIWIIAGNFKTWWAVQTEYGRGGWKGGAKPFMRPAMAKAPAAIKSALEGGHGETKGFI